MGGLVRGKDISSGGYVFKKHDLLFTFEMAIKAGSSINKRNSLEKLRGSQAKSFF